MSEKTYYHKKPEIGDKRTIFCNTCRNENRHELKSSHLRICTEFEEIAPGHQAPIFTEEFEYRLWFCCGCNTGTLEQSYTHDGMGDEQGQIWESTYYPKRQHNDLPYKRFVHLDPGLAKIYKEVIDSFNGGMSILCALGMRALIEGICAEKGILGRTLVQKIPKLEQYLPKNIVDSLHSFRFIGNEAAHKLQAPKKDELRSAVEVIEDLLNILYELDYKVSRLPKAKKA